MIKKRLRNELRLKVPSHILAKDLAEREAIAHELEPVPTPVLNVVILETWGFQHQAPVNKRPRVLCCDLTAGLTLVIPRSAAAGPHTDKSQLVTCSVRFQGALTFSLAIHERARCTRQQPLASRRWFECCQSASSV